MTKRTYVKPEWHAMGMPIAAAACHTGAEDVGTMGYCQPGGLAVSTCGGGTNVNMPPNQCVPGAEDDQYCRTGGSASPGIDCATGGFAIV